MQGEVFFDESENYYFYSLAYNTFLYLCNDSLTSIELDCESFKN